MSLQPYKIIGNHLYKARKQLNLTQEDVADRAHISRNFYGRIERGLTRTTLDIMLDICDVLHVSIEEVVRGIPTRSGDTSNHIPPDEKFAQFFDTVNEEIKDDRKEALMDIANDVKKIK